MVTGVGKRQHFYVAVSQVLSPMLFVEALGRPVGVFHNFPLANAREMARQVAQPLFVLLPRSLSRDAGASWRAIAASSVLRRAALCGDRPVLPPWLRVLGEAHGGRSAPRASSWRTAHIGRRAELPAPPGCGRKRPLPAAGAASAPTRMTPHESALWQTGHC